MSKPEAEIISREIDLLRWRYLEMTGQDILTTDVADLVPLTDEQRITSRQHLLEAGEIADAEIELLPDDGS